jgi:hypothetical protein
MLITWKCPNCWTEYEIDEKFSEALKQKKDCKFCVRKDPNVPTTAEMDGMFTIEAMRNRFNMVYQCVECRKWTVHMNWRIGEGKTHPPCSNCGITNYDPTSCKSLDTYNPVTDNKRTPKKKK